MRVSVNRCSFLYTIGKFGFVILSDSEGSRFLKDEILRAALSE